MTEKEAWLWLAECWDDVGLEKWGGKRLLRPAHYTDCESGLCDSVESRFTEISGRNAPGVRMARRLARFQPHDKVSDTDYWWRLTKQGASHRVYACLFLAAMCDQ